MNLAEQMLTVARQAKLASRELAKLSTAEKNACLLAMADALVAASEEIKAANALDMTAGAASGLATAMLDRLKLDDKRIAAMAKGLREVAALPDPVGRLLDSRTRPNGLKLQKISSPIGVIVIIYESRPNVTADAASLCFKSSNATILRGGKEAIHSNSAIARTMLTAAKNCLPHFPEHAIQVVQTTDRQAVKELLALTQYIDLCMPRGGESLIRAVAESSKVPVIKHYKGVCHIYVSRTADLKMAEEIVVNAKCQRPGVCNAVETLLVDSAVANKFLPQIARVLTAQKVELRGDDATRALLHSEFPQVKAATEEDWTTEYMDLILAVRVVDGVKAAIDHINTYGSAHSDTIVTADEKMANQFLGEVDSATVYWNASTRFTDGGEFGMGAEIGISTDKIGARGPMGLEELTTYKWLGYGSGTGPHLTVNPVQQRKFLSTNPSAAAAPEPTPAAQAHFIREHLPKQGLFAGHEWRISPTPLKLGEEMATDLERLGRVLLQFNKAVNRLYRQSIDGKQPAWVAELLDQGKPAELIEVQRSAALKNELPRVLRPDLLITDHGLKVTELDSVPGGIGLTAWMNQTYAQLGFPVLGGARGMLDGFAGIFGAAPQVHIVVSEESATYGPEMAWVAEQLGNGRFNVRDATFTDIKPGEAAYRFFELFDTPNVANAKQLFQLAQEKQIRLTPPPKPIFEEKLLFGLLWNRNLREFWRQELGESFLQRMQQLVPYSWIVDPAPLPPQGAIPELNLTDWKQLKTLSQRERELILKVSGFSPNAWGARGVYLGNDLSHADWAAAVDEAIASYATSPSILQRYEKPGLVDFQWFDFAKNELIAMPGRVRLCPYYFVGGDGDAARAELGGILATVCPANKKIIHGMTEAVFAPAIK